MRKRPAHLVRGERGVVVECGSGGSEVAPDRGRDPWCPCALPLGAVGDEAGPRFGVAGGEGPVGGVVQDAPDAGHGPTPPFPAATWAMRVLLGMY